MIRLNNKIPTQGPAGPNGFVVPIWHVDSGVRVDQVYLTVIAPRSMKGPHLHLRRRGLFTCVSGNVLLVTSPEPGHYLEAWTGEDHHYATIDVPAGIPAALYNPEITPALVLNMPSPPWRTDDQDEYPVEHWGYTWEEACVVRTPLEVYR